MRGFFIILKMIIQIKTTLLKVRSKLVKNEEKAAS